MGVPSSVEIQNKGKDATIILHLRLQKEAENGTEKEGIEEQKDEKVK